MNKNKSTVLGISQNYEAMLCYLFGWLTGVIFLVIEKENKFVRFHAAQSTITFLSILVISIGLNILPVIGAVMSFILGLIGLIVWLILILKAYYEEEFELPYIGQQAKKLI